MSRDVAHALLVDLYELTMVDAYRREGLASETATFSLFVRALPPTRAYLVAAGLDDGLRWLEELRFGPDELTAIEGLGLFDRRFLEWLAELRFAGSVRAVPEGTVIFPHEPILEVTAPLAEAQLAETFLLNQITLQTTLATKAARCRHAAGSRAVVDFALRRCQGIDAGMKLARICALVGLAGTSNVAGAVRYDVPATGTMAHAFVQAHPDEAESFRAFARAFGDATVLLVDTYDTHRGIEHAIEVASECRARGVEIRGIRLDSGDLAALAHHARRRLDQAGFPDVQVFVSGGLDEHQIQRLLDKERAPIDGFGVGSALGVADDAPTLDSVYKLVAHGGRPVRKTSTGKEIWPGAKQVWRAPDWSGDTVALADEPPPSVDHRALLVDVMQGGRRTAAGERSLDEANEYFAAEWGALPDTLMDLAAPGEYPITVSHRLQQLADELDRQRQSEEEP
jgi:nicotinate phosphoribosyltransferase